MKRYQNISAVLFAATLIAVPVARAQMMAPAGHYEGRWEIQTNGDVNVTRTYKLARQMYDQWKKNNLHVLEARNFAGERSSVEVARQKADWDDLNSTLTMTMTVLGLCDNKADHWEARILPFLEFSNLDENLKIAFFHYSTQGDMGRMEGKDSIVLPPACSKPAWDKSRKVVTYVMPPVVTRSGGLMSAKGLWWISAAACVVAGVSLWLVSLLVTPTKRDPDAEVSV